MKHNKIHRHMSTEFYLFLFIYIQRSKIHGRVQKNLNTFVYLQSYPDTPTNFIFIYFYNKQNAIDTENLKGYFLHTENLHVALFRN